MNTKFKKKNSEHTSPPQAKSSLPNPVFQDIYSNFVSFSINVRYLTHVIMIRTRVTLVTQSLFADFPLKVALLMLVLYVIFGILNEMM